MQQLNFLNEKKTLPPTSTAHLNRANAVAVAAPNEKKTANAMLHYITDQHEYFKRLFLTITFNTLRLPL